METIGTFKVTTGRIRVTDPCYDRANLRTLEGYYFNDLVGEFPAVNGTWKAQVDRDRRTVVTLRVASVERATEAVDTRVYPGAIGVDSGQCGFFDAGLFPDDPGDYDSGGFYADACACTESGDAGIMKGEVGAVSSSGYGDGSYTCVVSVNAEGMAVSATLEFMEEDEEEEDDEEEEEEEEEEEID